MSIAKSKLKIILDIVSEINKLASHYNELVNNLNPESKISDSKTKTINKIRELFYRLSWRANEIPRTDLIKSSNIDERSWRSLCALPEYLEDMNEETLLNLTLDLGILKRAVEGMLESQQPASPKESLENLNQALIQKLDLKYLSIFERYLSVIRGLTFSDKNSLRFEKVAVIRVLQILGEYLPKLSETFRKQFSNIPYQDIEKLRHTLSHPELIEPNYFENLCSVDNREIPDLLEELSDFCSAINGYQKGDEQFLAEITFQEFKKFIETFLCHGTKQLTQRTKFNPEQFFKRHLRTKYQRKVFRTLSSIKQDNGLALKEQLQQFSIGEVDSQELDKLLSSDVNMKVKMRGVNEWLNKMLSEKQLEIKRILEAQRIETEDRFREKLLALEYIDESKVESILNEVREHMEYSLEEAICLIKRASQDIDQLIQVIEQKVIEQKVIEDQGSIDYEQIFNPDSFYFLAMEYFLIPIGETARKFETNSTSFEHLNLSTRKWRLLKLLRNTVSHEIEKIDYDWLKYLVKEFITEEFFLLMKLEDSVYESSIQQKTQLSSNAKTREEIEKILENKAGAIYSAIRQSGFSEKHVFVYSINLDEEHDVGIQAEINFIVQTHEASRSVLARLAELAWNLTALLDADVKVYTLKTLKETFHLRHYKMIKSHRISFDKFLTKMDFGRRFKQGEIIRMVMPKGETICLGFENFNEENAKNALLLYSIQQGEAAKVQRKRVKKIRKLCLAQKETEIEEKLRVRANKLYQAILYRLERVQQLLNLKSKLSLLDMIYLEKQIDQQLDRYFKSHKEYILKIYRKHPTCHDILSMINFRQHVKFGEFFWLDTKTEGKSIYNQLIKRREKGQSVQRLAGISPEELNSVYKYLLNVFDEIISPEIVDKLLTESDEGEIKELIFKDLRSIFLNPEFTEQDITFITESPIVYRKLSLFNEIISELLEEERSGDFVESEGCNISVERLFEIQIQEVLALITNDYLPVLNDKIRDTCLSKLDNLHDMINRDQAILVSSISVAGEDLTIIKLCEENDLIQFFERQGKILTYKLISHPPSIATGFSWFVSQYGLEPSLENYPGYYAEDERKFNAWLEYKHSFRYLSCLEKHRDSLLTRKNRIEENLSLNEEHGRSQPKILQQLLVHENTQTKNELVFIKKLQLECLNEILFSDFIQLIILNNINDFRRDPSTFIVRIINEILHKASMDLDNRMEFLRGFLEKTKKTLRRDIGTQPLSDMLELSMETFQAVQSAPEKTPAFSNRALVNCVTGCQTTLFRAGKGLNDQQLAAQNRSLFARLEENHDLFVPTFEMLTDLDIQYLLGTKQIHSEEGLDIQDRRIFISHPVISTQESFKSALEFIIRDQRERNEKFIILIPISNAKNQEQQGTHWTYAIAEFNQRCQLIHLIYRDSLAVTMRSQVEEYAEFIEQCLGGPDQAYRQRSINVRPLHPLQNKSREYELGEDSTCGDRVILGIKIEIADLLNDYETSRELTEILNRNSAREIRNWITNQLLGIIRPLRISAVQSTKEILSTPREIQEKTAEERVEARDHDVLEIEVLGLNTEDFDQVETKSTQAEERLAREQQEAEELNQARIESARKALEEGAVDLDIARNIMEDRAAEARRRQGI